MIGYAMVGTNDLARAKSFYDALMAMLGGAPTAWTGEKFLFYGDDKGPMFAVATPFDGQAATIGNGSMVALSAPSRALVDALHAKAIELGGSDAGAPGMRSSDPYGFYGAYFRDPDGNKLVVYRLGPPDA